MTQPIQVRDARSGELDDVAQLLEESYLQYAAMMPAEAWEAYREDIRDVRSRLPESQLIVAVIEERIAGAVTLYLQTSQALPWPQGWAAIRLLGVHPNFRGRGIGTALVEECIRRARRRGLTAIGLHTTIQMDVARRIYEKLGFVRAPEFDFHPEETIVVMAYRLDV
jgi:ribosomal protein S18 acetylase RimI-like enzyme